MYICINPIMETQMRLKGELIEDILDQLDSLSTDEAYPLLNKLTTADLVKLKNAINKKLEEVRSRSILTDDEINN